jgi:hypothetical protein
VVGQFDSLALVDKLRKIVEVRTKSNESNPWYGELHLPLRTCRSKSLRFGYSWNRTTEVRIILVGKSSMVHGQIVVARATWNYGI